MTIQQSINGYFINGGEYYLHHDGVVRPSTVNWAGFHTGYYRRRSDAQQTLDRYNGHRTEIGGEG